MIIKRSCLIFERNQTWMQIYLLNTTNLSGLKYIFLQNLVFSSGLYMFKRFSGHIFDAVFHRQWWVNHSLWIFCTVRFYTPTYCVTSRIVSFLSCPNTIASFCYFVAPISLQISMHYSRTSKQFIYSTSQLRSQNSSWGSSIMGFFYSITCNDINKALWLCGIVNNFIFTELTGVDTFLEKCFFFKSDGS